MSDGAKFSFSFSDGTLQVSGSELFVSQQVEGFRQAILETLKASALLTNNYPQLLPPTSSTALEAAEAVEEAAISNPFPYVLDEMNGKVKITKSIKGTTVADKALKLILMYLWGKEKLLGQPTADYKELRDLCEEYACLDSSNFSSTLTSKKQYVVIDGVKGSNSKICKLTFPGREKAADLLRELNES